MRRQGRKTKTFNGQLRKQRWRQDDMRVINPSAPTGKCRMVKVVLHRFCPVSVGPVAPALAGWLKHRAQSQSFACVASDALRIEFAGASGIDTGESCGTYG